MSEKSVDRLLIPWEFVTDLIGNTLDPRGVGAPIINLIVYCLAMAIFLISVAAIVLAINNWVFAWFFSAAVAKYAFGILCFAIGLLATRFHPKLL